MTTVIDYQRSIDSVDADQEPPTVLVTFELSAGAGASSSHLCGEFNDWSTTAQPMSPCDDGGFSTTIPLQAGCRYRYRYFVDGVRWENDWEADDYVANDFGGDDSVADIPGSVDRDPTSATNGTESCCT